jgi:hypothetical protein
MEVAAMMLESKSISIDVGPAPDRMPVAADSVGRAFLAMGALPA